MTKTTPFYLDLRTPTPEVAFIQARKFHFAELLVGIGGKVAPAKVRELYKIAGKRAKGFTPKPITHLDI